MSTRFGISQGMMMIRQIIAAGGGYSLKLMVRKAAAEMAPRGCQRVVELIVRVIHLIHPEHLAQAALVETRIVRHQGQTLDLRSNLFPDTWEYRSILRIFF